MKITVQPRRAEALRAGFAAMLERLPHGYSFETWRAVLADWDVRAFCDSERVVGMLMQRGAELHVAVLPEVRGKWLSRRLIREVFGPIFDQFGHAETDVLPENARGLEFVNRLREGFAEGRFDPGTIATSLIGSGVSALIGAGGSKEAASQAAGAQNRATDTQLQMFNTQNQQQAPYRQAGYTALGALGYGLYGGGANAAPANSGGWSFDGRDYGSADQFRQDQYLNYRNQTGQEPDAAAKASIEAQIAQGQAGPPGGTAPAQGVQFDPGYFSHQFNKDDLNASLAPNYEFMKQQGLGATANQLNASGGYLGGNALQGINTFAQNYAQNAYQQAFANYTANQSNIFNRLADVAGLGQSANTQSANLAGSLAPSIASSIVGAGQARAAGTIGQANALTGGGNQALGWYALGNLMNPGGGGAGLVQDMVPGQFSTGNPQYGG